MMGKVGNSILFTAVMIIILSGIYKSAASQTYDADAINYLLPSVSGTARGMGVAGAFGSVGADQTSLRNNPAGLGLYRSSEFIVTPSFLLTNTNSRYHDNSLSGSRNRMNFSNAGIVWSRDLNRPKKGMSFSGTNRISHVNFALSYHRVKRFDSDYNFAATTPEYSQMQAIAAALNDRPGIGIDLGNFDPLTVMAWNNFLVDFDSTQGLFTTVAKAPLRQRGRVQTRGTVDQIDFGLGFNWDDKIYFGAAIGIPFMFYTRNYAFSEEAEQEIPNFDFYETQSNYRASGVGVNLRLGLIYRPVPWWRAGISMETPTAYTVDETYTVTLRETGAFSYTDEINAAPFRFRFNTPLKGTFSNSFYFRNYGFFSVDYEFFNYGRARHRFNDFPDIAQEVNTDMRRKYSFGHTIRAGVELSYRFLRLRGGYSFSSSPFRANLGVSGYNNFQHFYTAGFGYRGKSFFADLAYVRNRMPSYLQPYSITGLDIEGVRSVLRTDLIVLSVGFRFGARKR